MESPLGPKYILYTYMDPHGFRVSSKKGCPFSVGFPDARIVVVGSLYGGAQCLDPSITAYFIPNPKLTTRTYLSETSEEYPRCVCFLTLNPKP